ncbi:hypothetical protein LSH36_330g11062 [Paralvinella palmiformis]|uniref:Uncharacterized protein n=1 Tax=Paralvinella palmiformis TaxID=53620 RepID=A0AAD9JFV3_9ANNE|nr:hypothetical protein LSH36_330g11062 [Paralvinella palmiformis]
MSLQEVFKSFCTFGDKSAPPLMDGAKFAKLFRDMKILDKNMTTTDVDIVFSKIKAKTERKINFKQFQEGLKLLAEKKYPGDGEGYGKLKAVIIEGKGPATHSTTKVVSTGAVDRLTDTAKFTGSHKERFDETGKGKGIAGRKDMVDTSGYVSGFKKDDQEK